MHSAAVTIAWAGLAFAGAVPTVGLAADASSAEPGGARTGDEAKPAPALPAGTRAALPPAASPRVELAICLDTSGSMDGLIDAARQKIWTIVNELALVEPTPKLRVALLTFGNDGHDPARGWTRVDVPFTEDLDLVSQQLFALTTNGGTELVARVLSAAHRELDWSADPKDLKLVVVAGNESAEQDTEVRNADACRVLIERGIVVNSIYCGSPADELAPAWLQVAKLADGHFASIDQQNGTIVIETPFDGELATLSTAMNETYLPLGSAGAVAWGNQRAQDANAEKCNSATAASRALSKAGGLYSCSWDLVEQVKSGQLKLEEVKKEDLPEKLRELSLEAKQKCVDENWARRQELQQKIGATATKRAAAVAVEMEKRGATELAAFDGAVRAALRKQAAAKGLRFKPAPAPAPEAGGEKPEPGRQEPSRQENRGG
ncbi:MAG: VWA domain-containing protein [Planctomycetes bacterium]|nr:VWA domain-containing protein [Planctomycetota bacterium]